ncbi:heat shock protein Hsp90 [Sistotremastrum niveocremeum HHB9708]|uniref:Heat shock protein Hsp90 n=1 Tax=Sistotremastrum niveocremeum HHB9708 TaxID=1314777 RepID=A0A164ZJI2_9AGAM|nr:heat shock protein Hsp90 [Sistotremastrum niveocremeum HHB9708]
MRYGWLLSFSLLAWRSFGQVPDSEVPKQKHDYQSDVARMRKIVVNSLYSNQDVFLRELLSNANDALEKLRIVSLTNKDIVDPSQPLNITIRAVKDEEGTGGRLIITDTGIGMSPDDLTRNLGTLAKSGTSEFLAKADSLDTSGGGNLIGQFGLGFYSSFLVADQVYVASIPTKSETNPEPAQYVFSSSADDSSFEIYPDPRGNTLGHGTEITLVIRPDASQFLNTDRLKELVEKHSSFSTAFPIYLLTQVTEEVIDEDTLTEDEPSTAEEPSAPSEESVLDDDDDVVVEEVSEEEVPTKEPKVTTVTVDKWAHLNEQPPLWMRDPKDVTNEQYIEFYKTTFKEDEAPLAWHHFQGESGDGIHFKSIIYIPHELNPEFWSKSTSDNKGVRLMVKRVFITNDLGDDALPKWASWLKVIVDADDLPLNVSRETLQSTRFLKTLRSFVIKHLIKLMTRIAQDDPDKYVEIIKVYGNAIKLGAVESTKERNRLAVLARWPTNLRNFTSLDEYYVNRRQGQKQVFFHAGVGATTENLAKSIFVEKVHARGYEVFLLSEPLDEILFTNLGQWQDIRFQDVAKKGLEFGDEEEDLEAEKAKDEELATRFQPLVDWLKQETKDVVIDVTLSKRLVTSPCAIVADTYGYSANMERIMNAQNAKQAQGFLHEMAKKQKFLEINPHSPLIEGLLRRVEQIAPEEGEEIDPDAEAELREVTSILIDSALVRSGFDVADPSVFFTRVDRVLRRSLGVSELAEADIFIKPAPPIAKPYNAVEETESETAPESEPAEPEPVQEAEPAQPAESLSIELESVEEIDIPLGGHDEL